MSGTPIKYLSSMGTYRINNVHGIPTVTVKTADSRPLIESHTSTLSSFVKYRYYKVVGVDVKKTGSNGRYLLILYADYNYCMVFYFNDFYSVPDSVCNFLKDPGICFVGHRDLLNTYYYTFFQGTGVGVGELAARVLMKPGITASNLAEIAREVGVRYDGPPTGTGSKIQVDSWNPRVLTEEMVKTAISDACGYYQIGYRLLSSLSL